MKYPVILMGIAAVMILVGLGIRMHADSKYTNKMYYHTPLSRLYTFDDVFAELKTGDNVIFLSTIVGSAGGFWFTLVAISRDRRKRSNHALERTADSPRRVFDRLLI
jgi:hypothetical protein